MRRPAAPVAPPAGPVDDGLDRPVDGALLRADRARVRAAVRARRRAEAAEVRRFTRGARRRRVLLAAAAGFLLVSVATPVLLAVSPAFAVRTVTVTGGDAALAAQVRRAAAPDLGVPIALVDGAALRKRLAAIAAVSRFSVARIPPGTLAVRVVPRIPVGQVAAGGAYDLVDAAGVALSRAAAPIPGVPQLTAPVGSAGFAAAARVLATLPGELSGRVASVAAATPDDVRLTLTDGRIVIWGSAEDGATKAAALRAALAGVARGAHRIDLSVPGSVSVG